MFDIRHWKIYSKELFWKKGPGSIYSDRPNKYRAEQRRRWESAAKSKMDAE